jgi:hypothetical protein
MNSESPERFPGLRELDLQRVTSEQIGTRAITSPEALVQRVEDLLLEADDLLQDAQRRQDPNWWRYADHRDDLVDVLRAIAGKFGGAST